MLYARCTRFLFYPNDHRLAGKTLHSELPNPFLDSVASRLTNRRVSAPSFRYVESSPNLALFFIAGFDPPPHASHSDTHDILKSSSHTASPFLM